MAYLTKFIDDEGNEVDLPKRPRNQYDPNGIARIQPKESRAYAFAAYQVWFASGMAEPWDGVYTDHEGLQTLNYRD